jgi:hypothetical protein
MLSGKSQELYPDERQYGLGMAAKHMTWSTWSRNMGAMPQSAYTMEDYGKGSVKSDEFQAASKPSWMPISRMKTRTKEFRGWKRSTIIWIKVW